MAGCIIVMWTHGVNFRLAFPGHPQPQPEGWWVVGQVSVTIEEDGLLLSRRSRAGLQVPLSQFFSSYSKIDSVIYGSGLVPRRGIFSPRETSPE
jgi:hypothetical protein